MPQKKIKLMFDATVLANSMTKGAARTGVYFTVYNILNRLMNFENLEITDTKKQYFLRKFEEYKKLNVYPKASIFDDFDIILRNKKAQAKSSHNTIAKNFWHYVNLLENAIFILPSYLHKKRFGELFGDIDVFFSPCYSCPDFLDKYSNVKKCIILYDTAPFIFPNYYPATASGNSWFLDMTDYLRRKSNVKGFAISEHTKKDFLKFVPELKPEQITVTPLAAGDNFYPTSREETIKSLQKYGLPTDKKYIFSLCSLAPNKNLIRAVKTFVQFVEKNKIDDLVFILGGGHYDEFIGKLDAELGKIPEGLVIKAGYIDDEDLAPLYSGAEWFVYTSQYEGFGLPPLEAMQCGTPVITSNNSSLPEVVGDAGIMIDWDSDEQHIKAYEDYYFHPELREQMRKKGLARAKEFSWDKTVDLMIKEIMK